jgi:hypothetical protein
MQRPPRPGDSRLRASLAVGFGLVAAAVLARMHGRMDEARSLAQQAHDLSAQMGDSYVRGYASTQLARAALGLGDMAAAHDCAVEALLVSQRLGNLSQMGYALELWATAELRDGQTERAGKLYALSDRANRQVNYRLWPTDAKDHHLLDTDLRAAMGGDRYEQVLAKAHTVDLDRAIAEFIESDPTAQQLSKAGRQETG